MWGVITNPYTNFNDGINLTAVEVRVNMGNYTSLFYVNVIIYPCPNLDAGLADLCQ